MPATHKAPADGARDLGSSFSAATKHVVLEDIHAFTARCDAQLVTPSTDGMRAIVASFAAVLAAYSDLRVEFSKVVEVSRVRGEQAMCTCPAAGAGQVTTGASGLDAPSVTSPAGITSPALVALPTPTAATAAAAASGGGDGGGITILPGLTNAAAAHVGLDDGSTVAQLRMTAAPSTSARAAPPTSAAEAQPPSSAAEAQLPPSAAEGQLPPFAVKAQPQALAAVPQLLSLPHLAPSLSITPVVRVLSCSPLCVPTHGGGFKPLSPLEVEAERCNLQRAIDEGARIAQWRGRSLLCTPKLECAYLTEATMREAFRKDCDVLVLSTHAEWFKLWVEGPAGQGHEITPAALDEMLCAPGGGGIIRPDSSSRISVVVLAMCDAHWAAQAFVRAGVPHVVCVTGDNLDDACIVFLGSFIRDVTAEESVRTAFFSAVSAVRGIAGASAPFELLPVGSPLHEQPLRHAALSPPISTLSSSAIDPPESFVLPALHVPKPSMREAHLTVTGEDVGNAFRAPPFLAQASNCSSEVTKAPGSPATVAFSSADMKRSARFARPCCGSWCMTEDEAEEAARWQEMIDQLPPPPEFPVHRGMLLFGVLNNLRYHRLVITFGKSGSGKATLAVESARWLGKRQGGYYDATLHGKCAPGGVFFVDIHAAVASADALGIAPYEAISLAILRAIFPGYMPKSPFASAYAAVMQVADELRKLHCILVLARFEGRSVDDYLSWLLDTLLLRCPGLRLLVSRQRPLEDAVSLVAPVQLPVPALDEEDAARLFWQLQPQGAANWSLEQATQYLKDCECDLLPGCVRSAAATAAAADIAAAVKAMGLNGGVV